ncbi:acid-activated periplasmic chaperone HdeB [Yersinia ruckeri]|uniref:Acid stress chaperone HdeB n=1 Tax=Yersinia ruckeri TaxID=29486 RepID=A0A0A8VJQ2_YERRU|nr:acid-activated periplasmic chaperone HdeB [Yersinia ruckeri]EEP98546.1 hypothetical protein yruck0001_12040 [Yersinia ruckeri ATCC 29473]KGA51025.1 protein hdeB [Yersinia ruckeri ATCC 29473]MCK8594250.1 acid-activated periplasmic chaperone HdeB [Yersinia ruckeri]MCK8596798.1 acid-activated periplasmic chaperone HdeB [Yersinia ruckeri]MCW6609724.1 acid-activated periplasmic chaperone HdeB [Yersinia ruckeri]
MLLKSIRNVSLTALLLCTATAAFAATPATSTTPKDMTCQEFLDLNPKSATPVVFWVLNDGTQYKNVDFQETDTVVTPKVFELCKKSPEKKLSDFKQDIMNFAKKHL